MEAIFWTENLKLERASLLIYDRKSQPMKNFHLFFVISQKQWKPNLGNVKRCCWVPDRLIFSRFFKILTTVYLQLMQIMNIFANWRLQLPRTRFYGTFFADGVCAAEICIFQWNGCQSFAVAILDNCRKFDSDPVTALSY